MTQTTSTTSQVPPPCDPRPWKLQPDWRNGHVHLVRAAQPRFGEGVAVDDERTCLPGLGREAQDFLAWRRSMLQVAFVTLAVTALFSVIDFGITYLETQRRPGFNADLYSTELFLLMAAKVTLAVFGFLAWKRWNDLRVSHRRAKLGWLIGFSVPFLVMLVPVSWLFDLANTDPTNREQAEIQLRGVEIVAGFTFFLLLLPSVLSLFIGAVRASLAVSRFMPESALPGWVAAVAAPILALIALAVFVLVNQVGGNALLLIGFLCIFANFMLYLRHGPRIARAHRREDVEQSFGALRQQNYVLLGTGSVLLLIALFTTEIFGMRLVGFGENKLFSLFKLLELVLEMAGKSTLMALLFADLLVAVVRHARLATLAFPDSGLATSLDKRLDELDLAGIRSLGDLAEFRVGAAQKSASA